MLLIALNWKWGYVRQHLNSKLFCANKTKKKYLYVTCSFFRLFRKYVPLNGIIFSKIVVEYLFDISPLLLIFQKRFSPVYWILQGNFWQKPLGAFFWGTLNSWMSKSVLESHSGNGLVENNQFKLQIKTQQINSTVSLKVQSD